MSEEIPDITNPKTFIISSILCIIFGLMIGLGIYITFSRYHFTTNNAISAIILLFLAGTIPAVFLHWWQNRDLFGERE